MEIKEINQNQFDPLDLVTISQLSREWKVTRPSIYKWLDEGTLKMVIYKGKKKVDKTSFRPKYPRGVREAIEAHIASKSANQLQTAN